jgi:hypothetical protein
MSYRVKKGSLGFSKLALLIVAILSILLVITILINFGKTTTSLEEEQLCRTSLLLQKETDFNIPATNPVVTNVCKTMKREVSEKIYSSQEVYEQLANYLANTAWMIDFGNIDNLFSSRGVFSNTKCVILYDISIPAFKKISENDILNYLSLNTYLDSTHYKTIKDIPYNYMNYIYSHPDMKSSNQILLLPFLSLEDQNSVSTTDKKDFFDALSKKPFNQNSRLAISVMQKNSGYIQITWKTVFFGLGPLAVYDYFTDNYTSATSISLTTFAEAELMGCEVIN